MLALSVKLLKI